MSKLNLSMFAYEGADKQVFEIAKSYLETNFGTDLFEFNHSNTEILYFVSGGSEQSAITHQYTSEFIILLASPQNNSYASATEVKAYLNKHNKEAILLNTTDTGTPKLLNRLKNIKLNLKKLETKTIGLLGAVSSWLVASDTNQSTLKKKLGISLKQISWESLPAYFEMEKSADLIEEFKNTGMVDLTQTSRVHSLIKSCIQKENLDAVTVECFSMVVEHGVTACLPLAKFNNDGLPAGCEGDIPSIVGKMFVQAVTSKIPWMANAASIAYDKSLFAHCTIAPNLVENPQIMPHFETGKGTALRGDFIGNDITVFRFNSEISAAFLSKAKIVNRPKYEDACRTQIEVVLPDEAVAFLKETPLGNHHLIIPGEQTDALSIACKLKNIKLNVFK